MVVDWSFIGGLIRGLLVIFLFFFFFRQKRAYGWRGGRGGSEMFIRDGGGGEGEGDNEGEGE